MQMTYKYIPKIAQREENLFLEEYYSGTDTKVYLDGKEQGEISYISFSLNEQLKPIFGYASRTFDDMAVGSRIVTGVFKMPIRNPKEQEADETIIENATSTLDEINKNNQAEEDKKNKVEWITNVDGAVTNYSKEFIVKYQNKLNALGFLTALSGDYDLITQTAIRRFQMINKLPVTGILNNDTMAAIDLKTKLLNTPRGKVDEVVGLYAAPTIVARLIYAIQPNESFYIIQEVGTFSQIETEHGMRGYIETVKILEV